LANIQNVTKRKNDFVIAKHAEVVTISELHSVSFLADRFNPAYTRIALKKAEIRTERRYSNQSAFDVITPAKSLFLLQEKKLLFLRVSIKCV